jgi:hypothetical protein
MARNTASDHDDHHHDDELVSPGPDSAECPVMPGRFVDKAKAQ